MIGLFGCSNNNLYAFSKFLYKENVPIRYILEMKDNIPHSMPAWDDVVGFTDPEDEFNVNQFVKSHGWEKPEWVIVGDQKNDWHVFFKKTRTNLFLKIVAWLFLKKKPFVTQYISEIQKLDFLIVCGLIPSVIASISGIPYMIFPHGSEFRLMVGVDKMKKGIKEYLLDRLIINAFQNASAIVSTCPYGSAGCSTDNFKRFRDVKIQQLCIPYEYVRRKDNNTRRRKLIKELEKYNIIINDNTAHIGIIASRINLYWKGHDKILKALANVKYECDIKLIVLGWGGDRNEVKQFIDENGLTDKVIYLPKMLTRPSLFHLFDGVDFVIDKVSSTPTYSATFTDAVSRGCPVFSWVGKEAFENIGWDYPPTIGVNTVDDIELLFRKISSDEINLDEISDNLAVWFNKNHSSPEVKKRVLKFKKEFSQNLFIL